MAKKYELDDLLRVREIRKDRAEKNLKQAQQLLKEAEQALVKAKQELEDYKILGLRKRRDSTTKF
jgi:F0F1-type ATP synthase membrane subunit b/b'